MTATIPTSTARVTVKGPANAGGDWTVVEQDGTVIEVAENRGGAREAARRINSERAEQEATESQLPQPSESPDNEVEVSEPELSDSVDVDAPDDEVEAIVTEPAVKPETDEVPEAKDEELSPEQLEELAGQLAAETPAENPAPVPTPARTRTRKTPDVETVKCRVGQLVEGDTWVRNDFGPVKISGLSKTGGGKVEVAYEKDGQVFLYDSYAATHARRLPRASELAPVEAPQATDEALATDEQAAEGSDNSVEQPAESAA